jgi:HlyD family secretion protein
MRCFCRGLAALFAVTLAGCGHPTPSAWQGYAEGDYLSLAAPTAGYLASLNTPRGVRVALGDVTFTLATDPDAQAAAGADARVRSAQERLTNLAEPRRHTEIAALEATLRAEEANLALAAEDYTRVSALAERRLIALQALDQARSRRDAADASVTAARATLATARDTLGRRAEVAGARSDLDAARAEAEQKHWAVERKQVSAPSTGVIADTYYRPGEWVASGATVASLLPDDRRRIRFFVPETDVTRLTLGTAIVAHCDGCARTLRGTVDYIAPQSEYTPPVIYSRDTRARLVFRIEATPLRRDAALLQPGLPLDVSLAP